MQLGTDLIDVNETLKSVVFVQYKMFRGVDGEEGYRPDAQLDEEIKRMDDAAETLNTQTLDESCEGYRLGADPFPQILQQAPHPRNRGSRTGIYVPLGYWKLLARTPAVRGPKGGKVVRAESFEAPFHADAFHRHGRPRLDRDIGPSDRRVGSYLRSAIEGKRDGACCPVPDRRRGHGGRRHVATSAQGPTFIPEATPSWPEEEGGQL